MPRIARVYPRNSASGAYLEIAAYGSGFVAAIESTDPAGFRGYAQVLLTADELRELADQLDDLADDALAERH